MDLQNSASGFKSLLLIFISLLCLSEANNLNAPDVLPSSPTCPAERILELKISGKLISHPNSSHAVSDGDEVEIICKSPNPVNLRYIGYPLLSRNKRKANSSSERLGDSCFSSKLKFIAEKDFTGDYECQALNTESPQTSKSSVTSVYIYVNGSEPYLLLNSKGKTFIEIKSGSRSGLILPCAVSNPFTAVDLEKDDKNITDLYPFNPKLGFHINSTTDNGLFKCSTRGSDSALRIYVAKPEALKDINSAHEGTAKTSITLNMYKNNKEKPTFECIGASSMTAISCNTPVECDFFRKCVDLQGFEYCKESTETGKSCKEKEDCRSVTFENSKNSSGGIIFCSNSDSEVPKEFKFFINKKGEPLLDENTTSNDTMNFGLASDGQFTNFDFVIVGEPPFSYQCNASKNVHSQGLQWGFVVNSSGVNETHLIYPRGEDKNESLTNTYSRTSDISFDDPKLRNLNGTNILFMCKAPRIDSTGYDVIYHALKLKVELEVTLLNPNDTTIYFNSDDKKNFISCTAKGNVAVHWTKNDGVQFLEDSDAKSITEHIYIDEQLYTKSSVKVDFTRPDESTIYRCTATNNVNPVGVSRNITVQFKSNLPNSAAGAGHVWTLIAAVLGFCLFVLTICSIIGGSVLYKRARPFPKELMEKFYNGYFESFDKVCLIEESDDDAQENPDEPDEQNDGDTNSPVEGIAFAPHDKQSEVNPKDVTKSSPEPFGSGQFGLVYLAEYRRRLNLSEIKSAAAADSVSPNMKLGFLPSQPVYAPEKTVVWKEPNEECKEDNYLFFEFLKEIKFMEHVGHHENIVEFIGCMASRSLVQKRKAVILMEYCALGDLKQYLVNHRSEFKNELQTPQGSSCGYVAVDLLQTSTTDTTAPVQNLGGYVQLGNQISTSNLIQWAYEISCGLEFLASKKFIHRDIAARNVLLTDKMVAKITDFGLARFVEGDKTYYRPIEEQTGNEDGCGTKRTLKFPIPWLPIESLRTLRFSEDSDIWAFGVTMWEIFSLGEKPYQESQLYYFPKLFAEYLAEGNRLPQPKAANLALYEIMLRCWAAQGSDRPRFTELKELINETKSYLNPSGSTTTAEYRSESESYDNSDAYSNYSHGSSHHSSRTDLRENDLPGYDNIECCKSFGQDDEMPTNVINSMVEGLKK